jgi:hypothetical protein
MRAITRPYHPAENTQETVAAIRLDDPRFTASVSKSLREACRKGQGCPHKMRTQCASGVTTWKLDLVNLHKTHEPPLQT